MNTTPVRYGYGDAGHEYDPDRYGRCRKAGAGYCGGTPTDPQHDRRAPRPVPHSEPASAVGPSADRGDVGAGPGEASDPASRSDTQEAGR